MSILINPTIYENTNYIKNPLIHLSFNNNIIDISNNYKYTDSNHIGDHSKLYFQCAHFRI